MASSRCLPNHFAPAPQGRPEPHGGELHHVVINSNGTLRVVQSLEDAVSVVRAWPRAKRGVAYVFATRVLSQALAGEATLTDALVALEYMARRDRKGHLPRRPQGMRIHG